MAESQMDPAAKRALMGRFRSKDTRPELAVRRILHRLGYRFRIHRRDLPGRPDIVLPRHRLAIFVHGCFWHRHSGCKVATTPKTRPDFWQPKFRSILERDRRVQQELEHLGWRVEVIWECETKDASALEKRLAGTVTARNRLPR